MVENKWVVNVEDSGFEEKVVRRSWETPVLVDFWASWCGPCRMLGPILEKLALEMDGRFVLAKIDSDRNKRLARQLGVRGIPSVKLFVDGQVKEEFTGALPESSIRQLLDRSLPSQADKKVALAKNWLESGDTDKAMAVCHEVLAVDAKHGSALLLLTQIFLDKGDVDQARELFSRLRPASAQLPEAIKTKARLAFAGGQGDVRELYQRVQADPGDLAAKLRYGQCLIGLARYDEGMDQFLEILRRDRSFPDDAARRALLSVFEMLGPGHPLVTSYRSRMSSVLFS